MESRPSTAAHPDVPAGWYPDPAGEPRWRWWDGQAWTAAVSDGGDPVTEAPLPPEGAAAAWAERGDGPDPRPRWPAPTVAVAGAGVVVGLVLAGLGLLLGHALDAPTGAVTLLLAQGGLSAGLLGACWVASRRYGSGRLRNDLGLAARGIDVAIGFGLSWAARIAGVVVVVPIVALDPRYAGSNLEGLDALSGDPAALVALVVVGVVVAPVVEEMFFRGLLQRALEPWLRPAGAIAVQAALFGVAHLTVDLGPANVSIVLVTAAAGVVFGVAAWRARRLGPSMAAHAFYNLFGFLAAFLLGVG